MNTIDRNLLNQRIDDTRGILREQLSEEQMEGVEELVQLEIRKILNK